MWTRRTWISLMFLCAFMLSAGTATAQSGFGIRAGASADPDQFYFGAHMDVKEVVERLWFRPNAELGVGDGLTLFSLNGEFVYDIKIRSQRWVPYVGGVRQRKGLMGEIKIGAFDSPEFKVGIGWTW